MIKQFVLTLIIILHVCNASAETKRTLGKVVKVEDGDTIIIYTNSHKEHVRLIGIDTPEAYENEKALRDAKKRHQDLASILTLGKRASTFVKTLVHSGDNVSLEFDTEKRDKYERLLAYVYLSDQSFLNEKIIASGYAYPLTIQPNVKYQHRLKAAFEEARSQKRGLWSRP